MRLAKLDLLAYGHFRGVSLDFGAEGLHVILGRNEAGKSTTLRAITGLLYGIDRTTPDAHTLKPGDLRIGGTLERQGERVRIVRRKGNTNTLLDPQDKPVAETVLQRLLGGVTQETFVHAYGLDHVTLAEGARALLEGKGDLGESLFDASVGGGGEVQRLLADLAREADAIYRPRGTSLPLNDALKAYSDAAKSLKERQTLPEAYTKQEEGLAAETIERDACAARKRELDARRALVVRARARLPRERQQKHLLEARAKLGAVPMHIARIEALREGFSAYERAVEQLKALRAEVERIADRLGEAKRRAGIAKDIADGAKIESFRVDTRKESRVNTLLRERGMLAERVDAATGEIARAERSLEKLRAHDPGPIDATTRDALAAAVDRARKLGDIEERIAAERMKLERQERALATKATALAGRVGWTTKGAKDAALDARALAAFVGLALPSAAALDAIATKGVELARKLARQEERIEELSREVASLEKQTASLAGDFAPPDAAALRAAREARDVAWRELRTADKQTRVGAELTLERLLRDADNVADRMIHEADRVTTLARLRAEADATRVQLEKARADREQLVAAVAKLDADLGDAFAPARIAANDVGEMRTWLERHAQVADEHARLAEAHAALDAETAKVARAADELASALASKPKKGRSAKEQAETQLSWFDASAPSKGGRTAKAKRDSDLPPSATLVELIALATAKLASIDEARRAASAIEDQERSRNERSDLRSRYSAQLAEITQELAQLLGPLGLGASAPADEVNRSIEALRDVFSLADKRAEMDAHVREAQGATLDYEAELARCLVDAASDLDPENPRTSARELFDRCRQARDLNEQIARVEAQLVELGEAVSSGGDLEALEQELTEQLDDVDAELARRNESIVRTQVGLEQFRAESHAADAANAAQEHLARVRSGAERWARARLAAVILAREIERYRQENQGPLLGSSSSLFARLTLNAYAGIKAGFDDKDRPCLRCVRADGTEVDVTGLSDGTRDQLYLALRLASLLRRAEVAEPMPLILDDVLIQLDDQRAAAALSVLAEVSHKMQVLFFTHHARLVDLAREAVPASELVVHTLGSATANVGGLAAVLR